MRVRMVLFALAALLCSQAYGGLFGRPAALLENVPLQWKPTSELSLGGAVQSSQAPIQFEPFQDVRADKHAIGQNREDENKPKPVTTNDDVGAFVSAHMRQLFERAGYKTVDANGAIVIKGEVRRFFVEETSTYRSELVVHLSIEDVNGKTLWSGLVPGDATRFGRSYKLENYYEELSDAVVNAVSSLLRSDEVLKALQGASPST